MKHLKMDVGLLEPVKRTIFFNPDDRLTIDALVLSSDIIKIETKWMALNHCVITPDVEVDVEMTMGYDFADIMNNEFTVVLTNYFK